MRELGADARRDLDGVDVFMDVFMDVVVDVGWTAGELGWALRGGSRTSSCTLLRLTPTISATTATFFH